MLNAADLLAQAKVVSGLDDYSDMGFAEGFHVLVNSINDEAGLPPPGEVAVAGEIVRMLANRLRMQRDLTHHPEILDEVILPPVFITSLPRTGSTKLHRMLAAGGSFNTMKYWQAYNFAPFSAQAAEDPDPRIAAAESYLQWFRQRSPLAMDGHPVYAEETEEESLLLDPGFNSVFNHNSYMNVPTYIAWAMQQDPRGIFVYLRRILKYLQWQYFRGQKRRWLLKTPALLGLEGRLAETFPGTDFIVTHRQPEQIVASACTLLRGYRSLYSDGDHANVAGQFVLEGFAQMVKAHLTWREQYPPEKVLDIRFDAIVRDEFALLPQIYSFLQIPYREATRLAVERWLALDAGRRVPPVRYSLADYGLTVDQVNGWFAGYLSRYANFL